MTETRRGATHAATRWHLASRHRAPWKWIPPPGLTTGRGTAVQLTLTNHLSPLLDTGYLEETIRRHFEPLLDRAFDDLLRRQYPNGVVFEVDGRELTRSSAPSSERVTIAIRLGRRRTPSVTGFLERHAVADADREGIAISTLGKVIKRGWDWLGLAPPAHTRINGLIEAPDLAACLTLSKNDFIRSGAPGASFLGFRKAIQEVVSRQLSEWGDRRDGEARPRMARLEKDLERVLEDLAESFPLLRSLVDRRPGGQKRLPMPGRGDERVPAPLFANLRLGHESPAQQAKSGEDFVAKPPAESSSPPPSRASQKSRPVDAHPDSENEPVSPEEGEKHAHTAALAGAPNTVSGNRRAARYGLLLQFESRPGDPELGRLVDSTIWINDVHPAFTRAIASRSLGYHTALAVALALAPLAVDANDEHAFITQFLAQWGDAHHAKRPSHPQRGKA